MREPSDRNRALRAFPELVAIQAQLVTFEALLRRWQSRINLVGPATLDAIWWRHFADSAQLLPLVTGRATGVDLGSGGGFPVLVLALLTARTTRWTAVESDTRKAAFLREVSRETGADLDVVTTRAEDVVEGKTRPDIVTSRAFAPPDQLLALCESWFWQGTCGAFLVGQSPPAGPGNLCVSATPSRTGGGFVLQVGMKPEEV